MRDYLLKSKDGSKIKIFLLVKEEENGYRFLDKNEYIILKPIFQTVSDALNWLDSLEDYDWTVI